LTKCYVIRDMRDDLVIFVRCLSAAEKRAFASAAQNQVFLGSPGEGLAPQSDQELTVGCGEGFLGKAKNNR